MVHVFRLRYFSMDPRLRGDDASPQGKIPSTLVHPCTTHAQVLRPYIYYGLTELTTITTTPQYQDEFVIKQARQDYRCIRNPPPRGP